MKTQHVFSWLFAVLLLASFGVGAETFTYVRGDAGIRITSGIISPVEEDSFAVISKDADPSEIGWETSHGHVFTVEHDDYRPTMRYLLSVQSREINAAGDDEHRIAIYGEDETGRFNDLLVAHPIDNPDWTQELKVMEDPNGFTAWAVLIPDSEYNESGGLIALQLWGWDYQSGEQEEAFYASPRTFTTEFGGYPWMHLVHDSYYGDQLFVVTSSKDTAWALEVFDLDGLVEPLAQYVEDQINPYWSAWYWHDPASVRVVQSKNSTYLAQQVTTIHVIENVQGYIYWRPFHFDHFNNELVSGQYRIESSHLEVHPNSIGFDVRGGQLYLENNRREGWYEPALYSEYGNPMPDNYWIDVLQILEPEIQEID